MFFYYGHDYGGTVKEEIGKTLNKADSRLAAVAIPPKKSQSDVGRKQPADLVVK